MWDRIKTVKFDTPAGELKISCGFQGESNCAVSWYESPYTASESLSSDLLREYSRQARVLVGADPDPYLEACAAGADPSEVCGPGRAKEWLSSHNGLLQKNDYDAKRYGTNWVREAYAREKFDHMEMERLMGIAVEAGDKTEPYPWSSVPAPGSLPKLPQSVFHVEKNDNLMIAKPCRWDRERVYWDRDQKVWLVGSRKHWRWQWGTVSKDTLVGASLAWCVLGIFAMIAIWSDPPRNDVPLWAWLVYSWPALAWVCLGFARGLRWLWRNPPLRRE